MCVAHVFDARLIVWNKLIMFFRAWQNNISTHRLIVAPIMLALAGTPCTAGDVLCVHTQDIVKNITTSWFVSCCKDVVMQSLETSTSNQESMGFAFRIACVQDAVIML
eukprot:1940882-Amphidinium_carterae.1